MRKIVAISLVIIIALCLLFSSPLSANEDIGFNYGYGYKVNNA